MAEKLGQSRGGTDPAAVFLKSTEVENGMQGHHFRHGTTFVVSHWPRGNDAEPLGPLNH